MHALLKKFPEVEIRIKSYSEMLLSKIQESEARINDEERKLLDNLSTIIEQRNLKEEPTLISKERKH